MLITLLGVRRSLKEVPNTINSRLKTKPSFREWKDEVKPVENEQVGWDN